MTKLYRPVGLHELALIWDSGCREFPERLPDQPIFYPVLSSEYATQIARDWNTRSSSSVGYVTSFEVNDDFLSRYERHVVGSAIHEEYWVPATELPEFNKSICGQVEVDVAFFGDSFKGFIADRAGLRGRNAEEQFVALARSWDYSSMDFVLEIVVNSKAIYLNCLFWLVHDFTSAGISPDLKNAVLVGLVETWKSRLVEPHLPAGLRKS
jgi:hypothetical protein